MPSILVRKCHQTGLLFEDDKLFKKHLRSLRKNNTKKRSFRKKHNELMSVYDNIRFTATCPLDIENAIKANWESFIIGACLRNNGAGELEKVFNSAKKYPKLVSIDLEVRWNDFASNSHSCPLDGVTNWGGYKSKEDVPRNYPGWTGRINYKLDKDYPGFGSEYFSNPRCGIHTGSGGGSYLSLSYQVTLFESDWPKMAEERRKALAWSILNGAEK